MISAMKYTTGKKLAYCFVVPLVVLTVSHLMAQQPSNQITIHTEQANDTISAQ